MNLAKRKIGGTAVHGPKDTTAMRWGPVLYLLCEKWSNKVINPYLGKESQIDFDTFLFFGGKTKVLQSMRYNSNAAGVQSCASCVKNGATIESNQSLPWEGIPIEEQTFSFGRCPNWVGERKQK